MKVILAIAALLAGGPAPSAAPGPTASCQSFTRTSAGAPEVVRTWLARSADDHVVVCTPQQPHDAADAVPVYTGETAVTRHGAVCSYARRVLSAVGDGAGSRLRHDEHGDAVGMVLASGDCPAPHSAAAPDRYTLTYDLSPAAFVSIMAFWAAATASPQAFERATACCKSQAAAAAPGSRLREAIDAGHHIGTAAVRRIVRLSGASLRQRYALFVSDPDSRPTGAPVYVIYLSKWLGVGSYRITGVTEAAS